MPQLLLKAFCKKAWQNCYFLYNQSLILYNRFKTYLPANFYITQIGFFCKQEIKFEKITKIPFRFRLGSVEECDRMEGKRK